MTISRTLSREAPTLVFPAGMPDSLDFLDRALLRGAVVVGASSRGHEPVRERYPNWAQLPYITEPGFDEALCAAIEAHGIGRIYSPHIVVWHYLSEALPRIAPRVQLVNDSPMQADLVPYRAAKRFAESLLQRPLPLAAAVEPQSPLSTIEAAALFKHAECIPGMCDHEKFEALCETLRYAVPGDLVEIGSYYGKSAFMLLSLARRYAIGNVLCVDPWSVEQATQNDDTGMVDALVPQLKDTEILAGFQINLLPYAQGRANYLRMPSVEAAQRYAASTYVDNEVFGTVVYAQRVAVLHIDGNHHYDYVSADIASWTPFVCNGGWIIVDDYRWPFGDGPRRAGDEYFAANRERIDCCFVMGGALFMRLAA